MISPFLKKLLFARQFYMIDGKIEILGKKQIMLPSNVVYELQKINPEIVYSYVKKAVLKDFEDYAKKLGSSEGGMLKSIDHIFETFGLGKLEIVDLDYKKKKGIVRLHNPPLMERKQKDGFQIISAILSGTFSFLFSKDVNAKKTNSMKGLDYYEYVLK